jgi:glycosyltransferase involved in cell wall biosynthesis
MPTRGARTPSTIAAVVHVAVVIGCGDDRFIRMAGGSQRDVTVVIPTHNRQHLVPRAVASALGQRDVEVQVVVVDDGSRDATPAVLASIDDDRLRVVRHDRAQRLPRARNAGICRAEGTWVAFLDDDDLWAPDRLSAQLDALHRTGAAWACSGTVLVDEQLDVLGFHPVPDEDEVAEELLQRNVIPGGGSGVIARRDLVHEVGAFDPSLVSVEDWDLWIRLSLESPIATVPEPHVGYLIHSGGMSRNIARMVEGRDRVIDKFEDERRSRGLHYDYRWWSSYVLGLQRASGDRLGAARAKLEMFDGLTDVRGWMGVATNFAAPGLIERRYRRQVVDGADGASLASARRWLSAFPGEA